MLIIDPADVAAVVAGLSAITIFFAERLSGVWRTVTARSTWLGRIENGHAPTGKVLRDLRGASRRLFGYMYSPAYSGAIWVFLIPQFLPTWAVPPSQRFSFGLLLLNVYSVIILVAVNDLLGSRVIKRLVEAKIEDGVPVRARKNFQLAKDLALGFAPGVLGAAAGQGFNLINGTAFSPTLLVQLGGIAYISFLIYSEGWFDLRADEQFAYVKWVGGSSKTRPICEIALRRESHRASEQVIGGVTGVGVNLQLLRGDGFIEEIDWGDIRRLAVKGPISEEIQDPKDPESSQAPPNTSPVSAQSPSPSIAAASS